MALESSPVDLEQKKKVESLRQRVPYELQESPTYVWHKKDVLGRGSFGKVCRGWNKQSFDVVAVKIVRREHYERDAKVRENLVREIKIQKNLGDCENVVKLFEIEKSNEGRILIMELCDSDLQQHLKRVKGLDESSTKDFLKQIANGLKRMHDAGIVHRDLKPGNILLKRDALTHKITYKLADFGFARSFLSDEQKTLQMQSLAGTPVFMAPEALECVFYHGKTYNQKVDLWSVGALLYNCLIGKPGFYANLQMILDILKRKGDAIAFERNAPGGTRYINELPSEVDSRLSKGFKKKMNELMRRLLALDAKKRMSYPDFFSFVDSLNAGEIVLFHVGPGQRYEISPDPNESCKSLITRLLSRAHLPCPRDRAVVITERGVENLANFDDVPEFLKIPKESPRIFIYNEESLDSSLVPNYTSPAVKQLNESLQDATERNRLIYNAKRLADFCEFVLKDAREWSNSQIKGLHCYQALLATCNKEMGRVCAEASQIREAFRVRAACMKECMEADRECLAQFKTAAVDSLNAGFEQFHEKEKQFLSDVDEIVGKSRQTIENIKEVKNQPFASNHHSELAALVHIGDEVKRLSGEESLKKAEFLLRSTKDYHVDFIDELHKRMRETYFPLREGRFISEQLRLLRIERLEETVKELMDVQRNVKKSIFQAMAQDEASETVVAELKHELQEQKQKCRQLEGKLIQVNEKIAEKDRLANDEVADDFSDFSIIPRAESPKETATEKKDNGSLDSPDGAATAANEPDPEATIVHLNPEATIQPDQQPSLDDVKVPKLDVQKACQGLQLAANFYRNLSKMTRVGNSLSATSPADGSSSRSSSRSSTLPFLSVSPSEIPPSEDLKTLAAEVNGFEYRKIQEALGSKISLSNFGIGDLIVFWPTNALRVYRAMTTTKNTYVLHKASLKDYGTDSLSGRAILTRAKTGPVATVAGDEDKYKMKSGQNYYVIRADIQQTL